MGNKMRLKIGSGRTVIFMVYRAVCMSTINFVSSENLIRGPSTYNNRWSINHT